jgi:hypothetical protein
MRLPLDDVIIVSPGGSRAEEKATFGRGPRAKEFRDGECDLPGRARVNLAVDGSIEHCAPH